MDKTPAMHGAVKNVVEPLTTAALHYKLSDSLEAPRGFKLFQVRFRMFVAETYICLRSLCIGRGSSRVVVGGSWCIVLQKIGASRTCPALQYRTLPSPPASLHAASRRILPAHN